MNSNGDGRNTTEGERSAEHINDGDLKERDPSILFGLSEKEKDKAVQYLARTIPEDTFEEIAESIRSDGPDWKWKQHYGVGVYVRDLLREGEIYQGDPETTWAEFIEKAVKENKGNR